MRVGVYGSRKIHEQEYLGAGRYESWRIRKQEDKMEEMVEEVKGDMRDLRCMKYK